MIEYLDYLEYTNQATFQWMKPLINKCIYTLVEYYISICWYLHVFKKYMYTSMITIMMYGYIYLYRNNICFPTPDAFVNDEKSITVHLVWLEINENNISSKQIYTMKKYVYQSTLLIKFYLCYLHQYNKYKLKPLVEFINKYIWNMSINNHNIKLHLIFSFNSLFINKYGNSSFSTIIIKNNDNSSIDEDMKRDNIHVFKYLCLDLSKKKYVFENAEDKSILYDTIKFDEQNYKNIEFVI